MCYIIPFLVRLDVPESRWLTKKVMMGGGEANPPRRVNSQYNAKSYEIRNELLTDHSRQDMSTICDKLPVILERKKTVPKKANFYKHIKIQLVKYK